jgi:hypothetical protein
MAEKDERELLAEMPSNEVTDTEEIPDQTPEPQAESEEE